MMCYLILCRYMIFSSTYISIFKVLAAFLKFQIENKQDVVNKGSVVKLEIHF